VRADPVERQVFANLLASVAEEMGAVLERAAASTNIKERRDFSAAVFDARGRMVAQAAHIPVHLGSAPLSVRAALAALDLGPGDVALLNDPWGGGTHLPDLTLVAPVFLEGRRAFLVSTRAHHADVGGAAPGSMGLATEVFQEGVRIPPIRLVERGRWNRDALRLFLANVRTPAEREVDLAAQVAAQVRGVARLGELAERYGVRRLRAAADDLLRTTGAAMRAELRRLPRGLFRFEDALEDDGMGTGPIPIRVALRLGGGRAAIDFAGTHPQVPGPVNANRAITVSAVFYVFRCLLGFDVPTNEGLMAPLDVRAPEGSVVNARFPAAVAGGNVETSQRIVDALLGALHRAAPGRVPAASAGTMSNVTLGGTDAAGRPFTYYETIGGGAGASARAPGLAAVQTHMTNTRNTPVEALELAYPLRVRAQAFRRGSGGAGARRGGDGLVRAFEFLVPTAVSLLGERRRIGPWGAAGGAAGRPGRNRLGARGRLRALPGKCAVRARPGDRLSIETPGGGGHGGLSRRTRSVHSRATGGKP
jgi:N-methylhydantoinase B